MRGSWSGWGCVAVVLGALLLIGGSAAARERRDDADARRTCRGNLMRVGELAYAAMRDLGPDDDRGEGWFLARLMDLPGDDELVEELRLLCPADPLAGKRDRSLGFRTLFSYPVRALDSHPLDPDADEPQVILACPHHDDGALVMTDDFHIRFVTREELGAPETGPIEVGETATSPALATLRYETRPNEEMQRELQVTKARTTCANHLRQLGGIYTAEQMERPGRPKYSGPALLASYRMRYYIQLGREEVLICPLDTVATPPKTEAESRAYDEIDLRKSVRRWVSYAVRDFVQFPLSNRATHAQSIMACTLHEDGANVLFDDGAVQFLRRDRLGLAPDDPILVGPDSKSELLRPLTFGPPSAK